MKIFPCKTVDTQKILKNAQFFRRKFGDLYCVVKCDAYGHSDIRTVSKLYDGGFRRFACANVKEACRIRDYADDAEILILSRTEPVYLDLVCRKNFTQTVESSEYAEIIAGRDKIPKLQIEINSEMNRSGLNPNPQNLNFPKKILQNLDGVYTHFPRACKENLSELSESALRFALCAESLEKATQKRLNIHLCATDASFILQNQQNKILKRAIARIGLGLYGYTLGDYEGSALLSPAMTFESQIIGIRIVGKNQFVGYGESYKTDENKIIATVAGGYANGISRKAKNVEIGSCKGEILKTAGVPCMDRTMIDLTPAVRNGVNFSVGDKIIFFNDKKSIERFAKANGTSIYEVLTQVR